MTNQRLALAALALAALAGSMWRRVRRYEIAERSMSPTLEPGDYVIAVRPRRDLLRGDVVIFPHPDRPELELVKRVVGLPGERLVIREGRLEVAGAMFVEPWAQPPTHPDATWQLGADTFVLGDNRTASADDSRTIGPLSLEHPMWRVVCRYWPPAKVGWL